MTDSKGYGALHYLLPGRRLQLDATVGRILRMFLPLSEAWRSPGNSGARDGWVAQAGSPTD